MLMRVLIASFSMLLVSRSEASIIVFTGATTVTTPGTPTSVGGFSNGSHTFQNDETVITSLISSGTSYHPILGFEKMDFVLAAGRIQTRVFYGSGTTMLPGDTLSFSGSPLNDLQDMFDTPLLINFGSDDTFIKSLDSIRFWSGSSVAPTNNDGLTRAGITIVERGANDTNFRVRAITGLDAMGNPNQTTDWLLMESSDPFGSGISVLNHGLFDSLSKDGLGPFLNASTQNRNQDIGALLIPFADLGIILGDSVFGYEVSINTSGSRTGLDLLPGAAAFIESGVIGFQVNNLSSSAVPEQPFANLAMALGLGLIGFLRFMRSSRQGLSARNSVLIKS